MSSRYGVSCSIADSSTANCWDDEAEWEHQGEFVQISAGSLFSCGVTTDSELRCWSKEHGEGFYESWSGTVKALEMPDDRDVRSVAVDGPHLCVVYADATLGCHGRRFWGYLRAEVGVSVPEPGPVPAGAFAHMSTGGWQDGDSAGPSCGVRQDSGELACWGYHGEIKSPAGRYVQVSVSTGLMPDILSVGGIQIPTVDGVQVCGVHSVDSRLVCWEIELMRQPGDEQERKLGDIAAEADASGNLLLGGIGYSTGKVELEEGVWTLKFEGAHDHVVVVSPRFDYSAADGSGGFRCHPGAMDDFGNVLTCAMAFLAQLGSGGRSEDEPAICAVRRGGRWPGRGLRDRRRWHRGLLELVLARQDRSRLCIIANAQARSRRVADLPGRRASSAALQWRRY